MIDVGLFVNVESKTDFRPQNQFLGDPRYKLVSPLSLTPSTCIMLKWNLNLYIHKNICFQIWKISFSLSHEHAFKFKIINWYLPITCHLNFRFSVFWLMKIKVKFKLYISGVLIVVINWDLGSNPTNNFNGPHLMNATHRK